MTIFEDLRFQWKDAGAREISVWTRRHRLSISTILNPWLMPVLAAQDISPTHPSTPLSSSMALMPPLDCFKSSRPDVTTTQQKLCASEAYAFQQIKSTGRNSLSYVR
jgi:hypothetical protein